MNGFISGKRTFGLCFRNTVSLSRQGKFFIAFKITHCCEDIVRTIITVLTKKKKLTNSLLTLHKCYTSLNKMNINQWCVKAHSRTRTCNNHLSIHNVTDSKAIRRHTLRNIPVYRYAFVKHSVINLTYI